MDQILGFFKTDSSFVDQFDILFNCVLRNSAIHNELSPFAKYVIIWKTKGIYVYIECMVTTTRKVIDINKDDNGPYMDV